MAQANIHEKQAHSNFKLLEANLLKTDFIDWQIIVAFYTALHIFECQLTKKNPKWREGGLQSEKSMHGWRSTCISTVFRDLFIEYRTLEERSKTARYLESTGGDKIANEYLTKKDSKECIDEGLFKIIKTFNYKWIRACL